MTQRIFPFSLALAALGLAACGGSDNTVLVDAPQALSAAEQAEFAASKAGRSALDPNYHPNAAFQISAGGATLMSVYRENGTWVGDVDYRSLQAGMTTLNGTYTFTDSGTTYPMTIRSYQGWRSGAVIVYNPADGEYYNTDVYGVVTPLAALPSAGKATYRGTAFDFDDDGALTYHVDFAAKSGAGEITGLERYGTISLNTASIAVETNALGESGYLGRGTATSARGTQFDYSFNFHGRQAEEIAGLATNTTSGDGIGFHGTRGAITE